MARQPKRDEQSKPAGQPMSSVDKWIQTISAYEREFKRWEGRADKIVKIYRDHDAQADSRNGSQTTFNILWSNVQTCLPATFSRLPKPDVSRRFKDNDPVGRVAALILERGLEFEVEHYPDYRGAMENAVLDRFLGGRGIAWVRYEPHFKASEQGMPEDGVQITEDADEAEETPEAEEEIDYECAPVDYVHWRDFGHTIARTWEEVTGVWRRVYMTRPALVERFGEELGNKIPLDTKPEDLKKTAGVDQDLFQACVYEIWDKSTNKAYWLSKTHPDMLDERDDPLELENFFPCPRPLFATLTTDSLVPVPDYKLYQDQARELDTLADRISGLIGALKVRGVYDASQPALARLFTEGDNTTLIPVQAWAQFAEKNGLAGSIDLVDLQPLVAALNEAYNSVDQVKNQIYEIMGIADIIRGSSDPNETATAVATKGQFGSMRLRAMQTKVARFAEEILQIKAQIMCRWFQPETLGQIAGVQLMSPADQQLVPQALEMLKNASLRDFRIEVSADSMVQIDEVQEKADRVEFLKAVSDFFRNATQAATQTPQLAPLLATLLKFGVTGFKVGKNVEGEIDQTIDKLKDAAANPQNKPSDEEIKAQSAMQIEQFRAMLEERGKAQDMQIEQQRMQMEAHFEDLRQQREMAVQAHEQQMQAAQIQHQNELEAQRAQMQAAMDAQTEQAQRAHEAALEQSRQQFELLIARLNNARAVEVAEVAAGASIARQQIAAANSAAKDDSIQGVTDEAPAPKPDQPSE